MRVDRADPDILFLSLRQKTFVSVERLPRRDTLLDSPVYTLDCTDCADVIVELRNAGEDSLNELACEVGVVRKDAYFMSVVLIP